jgi:DNA polymerase I-like protein with 3'-5' exonuclease and polymerase domains
MVAVDNWLATSGLDAKVILQVHDELVLEVREDLVDQVSRNSPAHERSGEAGRAVAGGSGRGQQLG